MRVGFRNHADKRDLGGGGGAGVVDSIADVPERAAWKGVLNREEAVGKRLGARDVLGADDGVEGDVLREAVQRVIEFVAQAAGEDGEPVSRGEPLQKAWTRQPAFAV